MKTANREIKFRTWTKKDGIKYFGQSPIHMTLDGKLWYDDLAIDSRPFQIDDVLMQYTGLKDKNGKDIYEGDIVRLLGLEKVNEVINKNGSFGYMSGGNSWDYFISFASNDYNLRLFNEKINECEVIGNIYENIELLKTK